MIKQVHVFRLHLTALLDPALRRLASCHTGSGVAATKGKFPLRVMAILRLLLGLLCVVEAKLSFGVLLLNSCSPAHFSFLASLNIYYSFRYLSIFCAIFVMPSAFHRKRPTKIIMNM